MTEGIRQAIAIGLSVRYGTRLTYQQTADVLGLSVSKLRDRVRDKRIETTSDGGNIYFQIEEVLRYAETTQLEISA